MNRVQARIWDHIEGAARCASDSRRRCPPTEMFFFVGKVMSLPWGKWFDDPDRKWYEKPDEIADLIEGLHAERTQALNRWMGRPADAPGPTFWQMYLPRSEGREEFIALWLDRRYPPGTDPLDLAFEDALRVPVKLRSGPSSALYEKVISIAYHLQQRAGDRHIILPQQRMADRLKVSQRIIGTHIAVAVRRGLLVVMSGFDFTRAQAKKYRFNLARFDDTGREMQF